MATIVLRLSETDDVAVAVDDIARGATAGKILALHDVPRSHKIALRNLESNAPVHTYGHVIGVATTRIRDGEHVHTHNLGMSDAVGTGPPGPSEAPPAPLPAGLRRTFPGFVRSDGRVATRNYVGVLTTVNCSATVARQVVRRTEDEIAASHAEGVDGVVALTHGPGCGMANRGTGWDVLRRTLQGYARHPHIGALVVPGLGCEVNAVTGPMDDLGLRDDRPLAAYTIQDVGGTRGAIDHGVSLVRGMADYLRETRREDVVVEHLVLGLQCGGSDGFSGLTANPALGVASDLLVAAGGTSVLGETPEIYGAEQLLAPRATDPAVAQALLRRVAWWQDYTAGQGTTLDDNPSPGNKAGGLTTILEKSFGAVAKALHSPLSGVCEDAEPRPGPGRVFMDTPGYDPFSVTGLVAGGANVVAFTAGRGSVFGSRPAPTVKLGSNAALAARMVGDIGLDCSGVLEQGVPLADMGRQVYDLLLDVAGGRPSLSEELGLGGEEMVRWQMGAVL